MATGVPQIYHDLKDGDQLVIGETVVSIVNPNGRKVDLAVNSPLHCQVKRQRKGQRPCNPHPTQSK